MADFLIRDLDDETRASLKARAALHGRSASAEARSLLRAALAVPGPEMDEGPGDRWARRFDEVGLTSEEWDIFTNGVEAARHHPWRAPLALDE